jgi:hypothetical protein
MAAPKGNRFWEVRAKSGRDKIFSDEDQLWKAACEYFEWVESNPLWETKVTQYQGDVIDMPVSKMRAMTQEGLCLFLGISTQTWRDYSKRKDFLEVTSRVDNVIKSQKFAGAAADLLNANIIARDLGLTDKQQVDNTHSFSQLPDDELDNRIKALENELKSKD